jgi:hypothetical protein
MGALVTALINYDSPTGFSFNSSLIEFINSKAKLKLQPNPGQIFSQSFSSDSGFTYDNTKAEFTAGLVRQKDQRPANSVLGATFTSNKDLNWITSGVSGLTEIGSPVLNTGKVECHGPSTIALRYENANIGAIGDTGTLKLKYTPNYSGTPAVSVNIFELAATSGNAGKIYLFHSATGGSLRVTAYNSAGTVIYNNAVLGGAFNPVAGTEYEIELVWDLAVAGLMRCFIDGNLIGSAPAIAFNRGTTANRLLVGAGSIVVNANGAFNDVILFSNAQHTASYTPGYSINETIYVGTSVALPNFTYTGVGTIQSVQSATITESGSPRYIIGGKYWDGTAWVNSNGTYAQASSSAAAIANLTSLVVTGAGIVPVSVVFGESNVQSSVDLISVELTGQIYPTSNPTILTTTGNGQQDIQDFIEEAVKTGSDEIKYTFVYSGKDYYVSGGVLVESNGTYAQASTAAQIIAALPLNIDPDASVAIRSFLHSETGQSTPELESVTISYSPYFFPISTGECLVYGHILDGLEPVNEARVQIESKKPFFRNGNLVSVNEVAETTVLGYFSVLLPVTGTDTLTVTATWTDDEGKAQKRQYKIIVPDDTESINIEEIQAA